MIYKHSISIRFLVIAQLLLTLPLSATITLVGNQNKDATQSFSFPIQSHISSPDGNNYYVAAHPTVGNPGNYAISRIYFDGKQFIPLTPELITLDNGGQTVSDPLYNQHIAQLGLLSAFERQGSLVRIEHPIAVTSADPTSVHVINTYFKKNGGAVESALGITDATRSAVTSGIVSLGNMSNVYAIAATKANTGGDFGAVGSGLAVIQLDMKKTAEEKSTSPQSSFVQVGSFPLDITCDKVKIQNNLSSMSNNISMYWDEILAILYVGLQITVGSAPGDGGLSIAMLADANKGIVFPRPVIAPASAFTPGLEREIVGAINANASISSNIVRTMFTSTNCSYLIVQGDNGSPDLTRQVVYALPLVNKPGSETTHGTIADKTKAPSYGGFTEPATTPAGMTLDTDVAAQVGGGFLNAGPITDMFVRGDSVFVTVFTPSANQLPGMFYSQAIFDANGAIKGWTNWARVAGSIDQNTQLIDQVYAGTYNSYGDFITITGTSVDALFTVKRSQWGTDDNDGLLGGTTDNNAVGLVQMISKLFPMEKAGVQGFVDLPQTTPGLVNVSLVIATGLNQVSLVETGQVTSGVLGFNTGDFSTGNVLFDNGIVTENLPIVSTTPRVVTISGGTLNKLGPITSAEIAVNMIGGADNAWLVVGGVGGLAILTDANGNGWDAAAGLGPNFAGLTAGMQFIPIGNYSFVRKLLCDSNFLYVLTDKELTAIDLNDSNFSTGSIKIHTLATLSAMGLKNNDTLIDVLVSGKFALLATSKGLFRVADSKDITVAETPADAGWTPVPLPQSIGPATQLFAVTKTGRSQDFAAVGGSNVYVLNAYVGRNLSQLARYTVADVSSSAVTPFTIEQILNSYRHVVDPTIIIQAPLISYHGFRSLFATDGAAFFNARSRNLEISPFVNMVVGMILRGNAKNDKGVYTINPLNISTANHITQIVRDFASGNWLIAGDFGLRVNE